MKKLLLGLILAFSLGFGGLPAQASDLSELIGDIRGIVNSGAGGVNEVRGIIGTGAGIVNDIEEIGCIISGDCGVTPEGTFELPPPEKFNTIGENVSLRQYILNVLNFVLSFLGLIAVAALIYAGFLYVTSGGDDSTSEKSKKILIYAVIGILLILASFAIVNTVIQNAGRGTDDRDGASNAETVIDPVTGTVIQTGGGTPPSIVNSLQNQLVNPIIISGDGVDDSINSAFASLAAARGGLQFSLSVQALAVIDFGDNYQVVVNTADNPDLTITHSYGEPGLYTITAIVEAANGQQGFYRKQLYVGTVEAKILGPQQDILVNTPISLSATGSETLQGTITGYSWNCEDCNLSTPSEVTTTATFSTPGPKAVSVEVRSSLNQTSKNTVIYQVVSDTPVPSFSGESTRNTDLPSEFRFDASESLNVKGEKSGLTYHWNFDGVTRQTSSNQVVYAFPSPGSVEVSLYVTQNFGGELLTSETISQTYEVPSTLSVDFDVY